jgi:hypothetical protein
MADFTGHPCHTHISLGPACLQPGSVGLSVNHPGVSRLKSTRPGMARPHTLGTLQWTRQRSFCFVTQGHALWVFVHREMYKLQSRLKSAAGRNACPTKAWPSFVIIGEFSGLVSHSVQYGSANYIETSSPARYGLVPKFLVASTIYGLIFLSRLKGLCSTI